MIRRWILKQLGVLRSLNEAEYHILRRIQRHKDISADVMDDISEIIMDELSRIRRS